MVTDERITTDDGTFYIGADGSKTINAWMDLIPEEGDEEDDTERVYFGTKGKITTGKKLSVATHTTSTKMVRCYTVGY